MHSLSGHADLVCSVAVRADGVVCASGGRDKTIRIWQVSSGVAMSTLEGSEEMVCGLCFHPAAKQHASRRDWLFSGEKSGAVRLWSVGLAALLCTWRDHAGPVWSVALGARCGVSASHDTKAKIWTLPDNAEEAAATGGIALRQSRDSLPHPTWVFSVAVADAGGRTGEIGATGCGDRLVRVWSLSQCVCLRTFTHGGGLTVHPVLSVRLVGGLLASGSEDGTVRLWSLASASADGGGGGAASGGADGSGGETQLIATLNHGDKVRGVAVSPASGLVASCGGSAKRILVWRPNAG